jgi:hypothetical protein
MGKDVEVITRPVRQITIKTDRPWSQFRADYERAVPTFDRLEAIGVVRSGGSRQAIRRLSKASAVNGFVNFFVFDPSPVMHLNGSTGARTQRVMSYAPGVPQWPPSSKSTNRVLFPNPFPNRAQL